MIAAMTRYSVPLGLGMLLLAALMLALLFHVPSADTEQMQQSTVLILCSTKEPRSWGSGFVVATGPATFVVTNTHVTVCAEPGGSQHLDVILPRGGAVPIHRAWYDAEKDLAILRSNQPLRRPAVQLADTASVKPGDPVTVVGFPGAAEAVDPENFAVPSINRGNVSRSIPGTNGVQYFQHTAASNPGNSGGPVYDEAGNVIGVNTSKPRVASVEGISYAVDVAELLPALRATGVSYVMAGSLGPANIAMILVTAAFALLLAAGGILIMTSSGREWLFRRTVPASPGRAAKTQIGKIRILDGALAGTELPVSAKVILGRDPTKAQIVFPSEDTSVSRQHCEIQFDSAVALFAVRDLGSRNGTFVADGADPPRRLAPNAVERVAPGTNLLVGSSRNRLVMELG